MQTDRPPNQPSQSILAIGDWDANTWVANASWFLPVAAAFCIAVRSQLTIAEHRIAGLLGAFVVLGIPVSVGAAIYTLVASRKSASRNKLIAAVAGLLLNCALIVLLRNIRLPNFPD